MTNIILSSTIHRYIGAFWNHVEKDYPGKQARTHSEYRECRYTNADEQEGKDEREEIEKGSLESDHSETHERDQIEN